METVSKKKGIFDFFPVPRFLRMPAVGVDISDESVKFIELKGSSGKLSLGRFGKRSIPQGTILNGEVKDAGVFVKILQRLREHYTLGFVHASLPEEHAYVFQTRVPRSVSVSQIRNVLEFKLEENVPISSAEAIFDYRTLAVSGAGNAARLNKPAWRSMPSFDEIVRGREDNKAPKEKAIGEDLVPAPSRQEVGDEADSARAAYDAEAKQSASKTVPSADEDDSMVVNVSVYRRKTVEEYAAAFRDAGIRPLSFEIETQASARSVIPRGDKGTYLIVDFGRSQAGLSIVTKENLVFSSTLNVGGDDLNRAIMKTFSVSSEEAERIKNERGFINSEKNKELFVSLISTVSAFKDELNKHYIYWHTHDDEMEKRDAIDKIILCGGNANLPGLPEYLTTAIGVPVVRANVWINVFSLDSSIPIISFRNSLEYATTIGLALKSFQ